MEIITVGIIRTAFGIKGWLKLSSYSGEWGHFSSFKSITLRDGKHKRTQNFVVEGFRMHHGGGLFKLEGIDSPEAGKVLSGWEIRVPREFSSPLADGEWYLDDLIGLKIHGKNHEFFGELIALVESSDDLLVIRRPDGSQFMIPFRSEFVGKPDLSKRILTLHTPWLADRM